MGTHTFASLSRGRNETMFRHLIFISLCLCVTTNPKRVKDGLSDLEHESNDTHEHNPEYDHEAFLGKDEAKAFDELSPEESKEKLGELFHQVDEQVKADGFVTEEELGKWIQYTRNRYLRKESDELMKRSDEDEDGFVSWEEYKKVTYDHLDEDGVKNDTEGEPSPELARDEQRFKLADKEHDLKLNLDEFVAFLHPENHDHMKGIIVNETLHAIDKDQDGLITLDEYLADLWPEADRTDGDEPDWVKTEREQFTEFRDQNKDGKMDAGEVKEWIMPDDHDQVVSEAKHLISESDLNADGKISKDEMVEKYDLFVGSQATDFGEMFKTK